MSDLSNKQTMANNIKYYMNFFNKTRNDICNDLDISYTTFSDWVNGKTYPRIDKIELLANYFSIEKSDLVESKDKDDKIYRSVGIDFVRIPLYNNNRCGISGFVDDNIIEMIPVPSKGLNPHLKYFGQYAEDESMKDAGIFDGDLLIFEMTDKVDDGVIGCFCTENNMTTCKKYKELEQLIILQPMNRDFEPIIVDLLNNNIRCIGKLKKVIKDFVWED